MKPAPTQAESDDLADLLGPPRAAVIPFPGNNAAVALDLARRGFLVYPILPRRRGTFTQIAGWQTLATSDPEQVAAWWRDHPGARVGLLTGERAGLTVLDVDTKGGKDGVAVLRALGYEIETLSPVRVRTPSGGWHLFFAYDPEVGDSVGSIGRDAARELGFPGPGLDTRGHRNGGNLLAPGSFKDEGRYEPQGAPLGTVELPPYPAALRPVRGSLADPVPPETDISEDQREDALERIEAALAKLAATPFGQRNDQLNKTAFLLGGFGAHGREGDRVITKDAAWSRVEPILHDMFKAVRGSMRDAEKTFNRGWRDGLKKAVALRGDLDLDELDDLSALDNEPAASTPAPGWTFERFSGARLPESLPYLVRGLLDQDTAACVYGRSNAGKTFVVMDLAYHIATGQRWLHRDVQQAAVLYLALEGGTGFVRRVLGLREANGEDREIPFYFRRGGARLHGKHVAEDVREILGMVAAVRREAAAEGLPVLVVIDTLSRALAGGDENSSADMGGFVRAVDTIRQKGNATVLVVHHTGKDEARGMRGHSAFLGAIDTEIEVVRQEGDGFGTVLIKKQRDHEGERPLSGFGLRGVCIGKDAEGADVKTAVVDWGGADLMDPPGFSELTTGAKTAWRCFERLLSEAGGEATGVGKSSLRDAVGAHSGGKCSSSRINYANKAVRALAQAGFITCASGADVWHRVDTAKSST